MFSQLPPEVIKYLKKYSTDKWTISGNSSHPITTVVIIPAIKEYENLHRLLASLIKNDPVYFPETLFIFVVNNMQSSSEEIREDNKRSIEFLKDIINSNKKNNLIQQVIESGLQISLVDASSPGLEIPDKDGGVGYARKIGMDLALTVFDYESPKKKILLCLDADCIVKQNYLTEIINSFNKGNLSAASVHFEHQLPDDEANAAAIICYEIFLRYYVTGLHFAGSPYAYHTVGSTMVCSYESYIKAEGMNKRKAAEDFYFLEKIAKNSSALSGGKNPVPVIYSTTVYPSARGSWRVPFGTGQRVNRFFSNTKNEYLLYDPASFVILKKWLNLFLSNNSLSSIDYLDKAGEIHTELYSFLVQQKFVDELNRIISNSKKDEQLIKQKIRWFDAFKTMKFLHYFRDYVYPDINMFDAIDKLFLLSDYSPVMEIKRIPGTIPGIEIQKKYLECLRETDKNYSIKNDY